MTAIAVDISPRPPSPWAWALLLLAICAISCARRASSREVVGPTNWHVCRVVNGVPYECRTFEACSRHGCEWLGDPNGPGWGDVQQEGGWRQVP